MAPQASSNRAIRLVQDPVRRAVERIARRLPPGTGTQVALDFLEDDLREGLSALADVEAHFTDVLDALGAPDAGPGRLLEAAGNLEALQRLEYLLTVTSQLRRRLCQLAGQVRPG